MNEDYDCEGHGVRVYLEWLMPDLDEPILLGSARLPPITRNFVPQNQTGLKCSVTIDYVLAKAKDLERKSKDLLERCKYN
jgi:hypothetical protein